MTITYDPEVDALYLRFTDEPVECEVIRLNDAVAVHLGPEERVVGIEVLDARAVLLGLEAGKVTLENLVAA